MVWRSSDESTVYQREMAQRFIFDVSFPKTGEQHQNFICSTLKLVMYEICCNFFHVEAVSAEEVENILFCSDPTAKNVEIISSNSILRYCQQQHRRKSASFSVLR